jgi:hypothetical protein
MNNKAASLNSMHAKHTAVSQLLLQTVNGYVQQGYVPRNLFRQLHIYYHYIVQAKASA